MQPSSPRRPHLLAVGGDEVGPERVQLRVDGRVDGGPAAAVVDHARRRDRQPRDGRLHRVAEELEVLAEDRLRDAQLALDVESGRRELDLAVLVHELDRDVSGLVRDPVELVDEVHVPGGAAELAVRGRAQADLLLHPDRLADRLVLDPRGARRRRSGPRRGSRAPRGARAAAAGCRRAPPGTAASSVPRVGVWVVSSCTGGTLTKRRLPPSCEDESNARKGAMMAAVESEVLEGRQFIAGEWVASAGGETFDDLDPFTGDVVGKMSGRHAGRRAKGRRGSCGRVPGVVDRASGRTAAGLPQGGRRSREQGRRGRLAARSRDRRHLRLRHVPAPFRGRAVPPGGWNRVRADGRDHPLGHRRLRHGASPPGRRRRRDRALERGADPLRALDHRAARARQHGRAQAFRALAVRRRAALGRDLRRGGTARQES